MDSSVLLNIQNKLREQRKIRSFVVDSFLRRSLDIIASGFGLLVLSPVFLVVVILIKRDSAGPVFYRGPRMGKNGKEFEILKFRTMYERAESYQGPKVTGAGDNRITPIGRWLRDTKINELPQLWNVLVGDMSLVGPRPEDPDIVAGWEHDDRDVILSVRPGITSPASIQFRDEEELLSSGNLMGDYLHKILPSKLRLDMLYVQRRTILSDLDVILLTLVHILPRNRKKKVHESTLYHGPLKKLVNRHVIWFVTDSVIAGLMIAVTGGIWRLAGPLHIGIVCASVTAILASVVFSSVNMALGLHKVSWSSAGGILTVDLGFSTLIATLVVLAFNQLNILPGALPLTMVIMSGMLSFFGFIAVRYRQRIFKGLSARYFKQSDVRAQMLKERILIVGAGELGGIASWLINHGDFSRAFTVAGFLDDDPAKTGMVMDGSPVFGLTSELLPIIEEKDITLVIFAITQITDERRDEILQQCNKANVNCFVFPKIFDLMVSSMAQENESAVTSDQCLNKVEEYLGVGNISLALQEIQHYKDLS